MMAWSLSKPKISSALFGVPFECSLNRKDSRFTLEYGQRGSHGRAVDGSLMGRNGLVGGINGARILNDL